MAVLYEMLHKHRNIYHLSDFQEFIFCFLEHRKTPARKRRKRELRRGIPSWMVGGGGRAKAGIRNIKRSKIDVGCAF